MNPLARSRQRAAATALALSLAAACRSTTSARPAEGAPALDVSADWRALVALDLGATYDILDPQGQQIGWFQKDFGKSLLRSTFNVGVPSQGLEGSGHERNQVLAVLRRFLDIGWPIHFDFTAKDGTPILSVERAWAVRDHYEVNLPAAPNGAHEHQRRPGTPAVPARRQRARAPAADRDQRAAAAGGVAGQPVAQQGAGGAAGGGPAGLAVALVGVAGAGVATAL